MSSARDEIGGGCEVGSILSALGAALVGVILQVVLVAFWKGYAAAFANLVQRLRLVFGVNPIRRVEWRPKAAVVLPNYFREAIEGDEKLDLAIYDLSLRPRIPVMDLLYFEYLKQRMQVEKLGEIVVIPWSGHGRAEVVQSDEAVLCDNIKKIFGDLAPRVRVVPASVLNENAVELLDGEFLESVELLGDRDFLSRNSRAMGHRFSSYHDINAGRPERTQARSLVEHTMRGWLIFQYIRKTVVKEFADNFSIGHLMWERELAKTLVLENVRALGGRSQIAFLMGKDVCFRDGVRNEPLPTFESDKAIEVFGPLDDIVQKCKAKTVAELAATNNVVQQILIGNNQSIIRDREPDLVLPSGRRASRQASATILGLKTLRRMYGIQD